MWKFCKNHIIESPFGKFIIVGSMGFALDAGLTVLFLHSFGCGPLVARAISFLCASVFCWQLNRRWTFAVAHAAHVREYGRYFTLNMLAAAVNLLVYSAWIGRMPGIGSTVLAVALGTLSGMGLNFIGMRHWVFARRP
jgi:putative flippase GtrA